MRASAPIGLMNDRAASDEIVRLLEAPFRDLVFCDWDQDFITTREGLESMRVALVDRYLSCRNHVVPWLDHALSLRPRNVVEIGSGTGSSSVALAERACHVTAFEIDEASVLAARERADAHDVSNVSFELCAPDEIVARATAVGGIDLFLMVAVLEHLTESERNETLGMLWQALEPGGALAIVETPNRLSYYDGHSSVQDFTHLLPDALAFRLADTSPRVAYRDVMRRAAGEPTVEDSSITRARFGLGASYHEFMAAIDEPLDEIVVADGYEPEILSWFGIYFEEQILLQYMVGRGLPIPFGFARSVMNLVLRKPRDDEDRRRNARRNADRRRYLTDLHSGPPYNWRTAQGAPAAV
ncbi:MAG: methyltransferase domain-containing protein [Ilumatobacter sp.]